MSGWSYVKVIAGILALVGGILLMLAWGLYLSLWSIIGLLLGGLAIYGAYLIFREHYARGGTMAAAAAVVAWGLYPTHPLSTIVLLIILLLGVGGVMGLVLELAAD